MKQLFALQLTKGRKFHLPVSLTSWPSCKNLKPFQRTEKSVKFPLLFFSSTASPKILTIHPRTEAWLPSIRINYLLLHNTLSFIKPITNKALKHHWIRNDLPLKSRCSDFKKGGDWIIERVAYMLLLGSIHFLEGGGGPEESLWAWM